MKTKYLDLILAVVLVLAVFSGFATTWTKMPPTVTVLSVGMSADGSIIMAVPSTFRPVISTNSGVTWVTVTNGPAWGVDHQGGVVMSADGTTIIAALTTNPHTSVYISTNYGGSWTQTSVLSSNIFGIVVACSGDATKLISGIANGPICFSTNSGLNWYPASVINGLQNEDWVSVASSADGQHMAAVVNGGNLFFSTNFGALWAPTSLPVQSWTSVCLSSDGKWVGATSAGNSYISSNAGASWITNKLNGDAIACSANGNNWVIAGAQIYSSSDGGVTWQTNLAASQWVDGVVSADGCEFLVTGAPGLWATRTTPSPQLSVQTVNTNVALSWLVPSTNFVLQQNSDLGSANWIAVSNLPILNFTNLQDEVSVPVSASNGFFRLIGQ